MRRTSLLLLCALSCGSAGLFAVSTVRADKQCSGVALPEKIDSLGETLLLNGMGVRTATFLRVRVYVAGLYVQKPTRAGAELLKPTHSKQLTLRFVRHVSRQEITDAIRDGIGAIPHVDLKAAHPHVENMARYLTDLPSGTVLKLAYRPKQGLQVFANDKLIGTEKDDAFANLLFQVWLGPNPPDEDLKKGLLGGACE
jgi:Chalcone isomerase-like